MSHFYRMTLTINLNLCHVGLRGFMSDIFGYFSKLNQLSDNDKLCHVVAVLFAESRIETSDKMTPVLWVCFLFVTPSGHISAGTSAADRPASLCVSINLFCRLSVCLTVI